MRSRLLPMLLLFALALCTHPALAAIPSPATSIVPCVVACPAGDITVNVTVRDAANNPVGGAGVTIDLCNCSTAHFCDLCSFSKLANAAGVASFSIMAGGGCLGPGGVVVSADGVILAIRVLASPDQNGDLIVDAADVAVGVGKLGSGDATADFDCDGVVSPADVSVITAHGEHSCQSVPALMQSWGRMKAIYR